MLEVRNQKIWSKKGKIWRHCFKLKGGLEGPKNCFTLPETNIFAPENGWLEYDCFLLGWPIFRCYASFRSVTPDEQESASLLCRRIYQKEIILRRATKTGHKDACRSTSYAQSYFYALIYVTCRTIIHTNAHDHIISYTVTNKFLYIIWLHDIYACNYIDICSTLKNPANIYIMLYIYICHMCTP